MILWLVLVVVFAISWLLTFLLLRYAVNKKLIDIPNARSSHVVPTPRGGGVAIFLTFTCALPVLLHLSLINFEQLIALSGSGFLVALIGFVDDHGHIAARWRLLGHLIASVWALFWLNGLPPLSLFGNTINLGWFGNFIAVVYLVWMLNLYNFMDGIDGLASAEAIFACAGVALIYWIAGDVSLTWAPLTLVGAAAGFFCWNFPPARIFMGDAGSGFLGLTLGILSLGAAWQASEFLFVWLIMLGAFIVDATWTLLRRLVRGDLVFQAHRSHAYQFAARRFKSHKTVTLAVAVINFFWLWPIGLLVGLQRIEPLYGMLLAYLPLIGAVHYFDAGGAEQEESTKI